MRALVVLAGLSAVFLLIAPDVPLAAGGGGGGGGGGFRVDTSRPDDTDRRAQRRYDSARKQLERAVEYRGEAADETDPKKKAKLEEKATDRFERATRDLEKAIRRKPDFYEAHSDLGFALRSLGRYEEALAAYDEALSIQSGYAPAIEYRGEAYLELDRLDDAARAYQRLAASDPELAGRLLAKMHEWVERRRADPGDVDPGVVESFGSWVDRRSSRAAEGNARSAW